MWLLIAFGRILTNHRHANQSTEEWEHFIKSVLAAGDKDGNGSFDFDEFLNFYIKYAGHHLCDAVKTQLTTNVCAGV
eukprot:SAG31_NODE_22225_length_531_cov_0.706019_1_plen_77_part_00